jgi:hypothetical protein
MTYPPQQPGQPGPYGQDPYNQQQPGQYGQYGQQPGYPGGQPPNNKTGLIAAVAVIAVLVLGGLVYLLTEDADQSSGSAASNRAGEEPTRRQETPTSDDEEPTSEDEPTGDNGGGASEEEVLAITQSYVDAVNSENEQTASQYTCDGTPGALYNASAGSGVVTAVGEVVAIDETFAEVEILIGDSESMPDPPLPLTFQEGGWCVLY